jgi:multidrug efflux pump subunit AcrA (membrane-fusion protein)
MKKISTYLIIAVSAGAILTGFWVYEKYIKAPATSNLIFSAERKDIQETVKARGEVVSQKDFDLQFPVSGTVLGVYVKEGDIVPAGTSLMKLDTTQLELDLNKLLSHAAAKDVAVAQASLANAQATVNADNASLLSTLNDGYLRADDAVRGKTDPLFTNPRTTAQFNYQVSANDIALKNTVEFERQGLEETLVKFKAALDAANASSAGDLSVADALAHEALSRVTTYLQNLAIIANDTSALSSYVSTISTARTSISTAVTNLTAADGELSSAKTNMDLAQKTLDLKNAAVEGENADIGIAKDKITKSTLYAPISSRITKVSLELRESAQPGINAISLSAVGYKIQSDISELDIGKITAGSVGNDVGISLDAFPGETFKGKVVSVEPQPVLKDTDKYYRINIFFSDGGASGVEVRSGMSSDLMIFAELHKNAVVIPEIAMYKSGGESFVDIQVGGKPLKTKITTGISDGQNIEVLSGLQGGETLVISG